MTKKDYEKIAGVLRVIKHNIGTGDNKMTAEQVIDFTINSMAGMLESDNPRFDRQRFLDYIERSN